MINFLMNLQNHFDISSSFTYQERKELSFIVKLILINLNDLYLGLNQGSDHQLKWLFISILKYSNSLKCLHEQNSIQAHYINCQILCQ